MLIYGFYSKNPIHFKQFFFVLNIKKPGKQNRADFMSFDSLTESFNLKNLYQIQQQLRLAKNPNVKQPFDDISTFKNS
ncbi:hypothetical protein FFZ99_05070 [Leptospira interrogans]|nr:hypothetical protein IQ65_23745 [Leptospira interrogans serovar Lai]TQE54589.1 hypothetical protein FF006_16315 [Leptospira interrogans]TQE64222.1 hypothetical protein FFZ99_05070 [Leptospira interrogans]TQE64376.1 hypothetical protein FF001_16325 [Leptospira interrogans]TQE76272.1 hypothetical protein FF002_00145 [Leptospira interrogans]